MKIVFLLCPLIILASKNLLSGSGNTLPSISDTVAVKDSTNATLFSEGTSYTLCEAQGYYKKVIAGDFNNDGFSDIAVSRVADHGGSWEIAVLLNKGDGTFAAPLRYPANDFPGPLSAVDINGDGSLDLVVACHGASGKPDSLAVLINQGTGTFSPPIIYTYSKGRGSKHITTPDIDNDGDADVVATNAGDYYYLDSSISLFFNDGKVAFQMRSIIRLAMMPG